MLFHIPIGDTAVAQWALHGLNVGHFAAVHSLSSVDAGVLTRAKHGDDRWDRATDLARAFHILSDTSTLMTAVRTSFFGQEPVVPSGRESTSPVEVMVAHVIAERERVWFHESPHSGISRDTDLRFKTLAFTVLGFALQILGDTIEAERAYDLAKKSWADIPPGLSLKGYEDLLKNCRRGQWDEYLYYKLCEDFPGFIQARIGQAEQYAQNGQLDAALDHLLKANTAFHADRARGLVHLAQIIQKREMALRPTGDSGHTSQGTDYGAMAVRRYASSREWPYISTFVTPYFFPDLVSLNGQRVLDAGCGVGLWTVYAAMNGGKVYGIDLQPRMIEEARKILMESHVEDRVTLDVGDVAALPYQDGFFDIALSINVACNLPVSSFGNHFRELARVLKEGGTAIVALPTSLDTIFSNGTTSEADMLVHIDDVLGALGENPTSSDIVNALNTLDEVLSATFTITFAINNGRLVLVTDIFPLQEGQEVWRKLPNVTIPNRYHSEAALLTAIEQAGLTIEKVERPHFATEGDRLQYNQRVPPSLQLGSEYVSHSPFVIFHLKS